MVSARGVEQRPVRPGAALARACGGHAPAQDAGDTGVGIVRVVPVLHGIALDGEDARGGRDVPAGLVDVTDDGGSEVELLRQIVELGEEAKASAHGGYSDSSGNEVLVESCCRMVEPTTKSTGRSNICSRVSNRPKMEVPGKAVWWVTHYNRIVRERAAGMTFPG